MRQALGHPKRSERRVRIRNWVGPKCGGAEEGKDIAGLKSHTFPGAKLILDRWIQRWVMHLAKAERFRGAIRSTDVALFEGNRVKCHHAAR